MDAECGDAARWGAVRSAQPASPTNSPARQPSPSGSASPNVPVDIAGMLAAESSLLPVVLVLLVPVLDPLLSWLPGPESEPELGPGPPENDASPLRTHADAKIAARVQVAARMVMTARAYRATRVGATPDPAP